MNYKDKDNINYVIILFVFYIITMCGDIMITKNKTKSSTWFLVVSVMCAVLMTIVSQSLNEQHPIYAQSSTDYKVHDVAHDDFTNSLVSQQLWDQINHAINEQRVLIDTYILWSLHSVQDSKNNLDHYNEVPIQVMTWSLSWSAMSGKQNLVSDYTYFEIIKENLSDKKCEYNLPIDNTDLHSVRIIQWALDHCLITVSQAQKVYPNDILTHEMMRVIADRAWFSVKMDYASSNGVKRDQLLVFMAALQQHHKITDIPIYPLSNPVTRAEYLNLLYMIFDGEHMKRSLPVEELVNSGSLVEQAPVEEKTIVQQTAVSLVSSWQSTWLNKEMLKATLGWIIEKL